LTDLIIVNNNMTLRGR